MVEIKCFFLPELVTILISTEVPVVLLKGITTNIRMIVSSSTNSYHVFLCITR